MSDAVLTRDFTCYPPDSPGTKTTFKKGEKVTGQVAKWAADRGCTTDTDDNAEPAKKSLLGAKDKKADRPPENK